MTERFATALFWLCMVVIVSILLIATNGRNF
jgi:hypothetical protein